MTKQRGELDMKGFVRVYLPIEDGGKGNPTYTFRLLEEAEKIKTGRSLLRGKRVMKHPHIIRYYCEKGIS